MPPVAARYLAVVSDVSVDSFITNHPLVASTYIKVLAVPFVSKAKSRSDPPPIGDPFLPIVQLFVAKV